MKKTKNIAFWFGTEAEVIKSFPVILELRKNGVNPFIISTGQNDLSSSDIVKDFDLKPDIIINPFKAKKIPAYLLVWFGLTFLKGIFVFTKFKIKNNIKYVVVHGDTVSTLMGALIGKICGAKVLHLEAGLRSHNLLNPFPEEIDRIITGRLASVHFYQNEEAGQNLKTHSGEKIFTHGNVVYDAVDTFKNGDSLILESLGKDFSIITFHRAENVLSQANLKKLVEILNRSAEKNKVLFVLFDFTKIYLEKLNLLQDILNNKNIIVTPRLPYREFCVLMSKCKYIITDGGSNQEELTHLGVPTLVMRMVTERSDGIGKNIIISKFDDKIIKNFLDNSESLRNEGEEQNSPSKIVCDRLLSLINI